MSAKERQKGKVTKDSVTLLPCFYFVELPILASSVVSLYFLELTDVFKPVRSGYSCNDRSLSMPYIEPMHEVVPFLMLFSLAFSGPAVTIMIGEGILYCCLTRRRIGGGGGAEANINAAGCNFNSYIRRAVRFVGVHIFGLCATALITDIIQLSTGYHAPYFLTVCKPNYTTLNTSCDENTFIMEDICSGADPAVLNAGRKSFPSQHATLAAFAAVYVSGLYAVGNFQPSEDTSIQQVPVRDPIRSLTDLSQEVGRHLQVKNGGGGGPDGLPPHANATLTRNPRDASMGNLKRASADVEILSPRSPMGKESMVTFSNTLPRTHTPAVEEVPSRRNASIHASMDSTRSKQLLSQWKTKNESRKLSLQVMETEAGHSPQRSIEMRCNSEPVRVGVNGEHHPPGSQYVKLPTAGGIPLMPNNASGMVGGARVSIQSRPGSSQLVHIPEETQENVIASPKGGSARSKWLKVAEKSGVCRANSQPRIMQVIAMSKQQGLLQGSPKSSEGSTVSCTGSIRYKALTDQEPGGIVRVEAHPENSHCRPVVQPPSTDGSGSWKWKPQERPSLRQSFELNDLNRDSESCESLKDAYVPIPVPGPMERRRPCSGPDLGSNHHHHFHHHHHHPHGITTIRVTPVEGSEAASETLSIASSRDSTLRRKGNIILIPDRGTSPDNTRNIFFKGTSLSPVFKE
ncbi:phospholipid phosphatase-related protein type 4 isoform X2 [Conger conger]|uniref:phospholipid phosphatase-related protein type 4 isoform X2 n=1 Tax=Conger conger TaxID=82655 RepID=UPI002A59FCB2|nr:phospholipid phosphatase-related protein type 4 isoform X2 [Conger conger]